MQKELVFQFPKKKKFLSFLLSAITHSQSSRGYHSDSLLLSPRFPSLLLPSWELQEGDQSNRLGGPDWGLAPGPYQILWPFLTSWSVPPMSPVRAWLSRESEHWSEREPRIPSAGAPPHLAWVPLLQPSRATSLAAQGASMVESHWVLQKCWRNQSSRNQFIMLADPEEWTLQSLSPEQRDYKLFIHRL